MTETEVKLSIPTREVFHRLVGLRRVPGFSLGERIELAVVDTFKDTASFALLHHGLALRERREGDVYRLTAKGLGRSTGALHRREEVEEVRTQPLATLASVDGPLSRRILPIIGRAPLTDIFSFSQLRYVTHLLRGGIELAQLSVDEITMQRHGERRIYFELEVEAVDDVVIEDLQAVARWFSDGFGLSRECRTKFEQALGFFDMPEFDGVACSAALPAAVPATGGPPALSADMCLEEGFAILLSDQYSRILDNEREVAAIQSVASIHGMRVAAQRARALLRLGPRTGPMRREAIVFLKVLRDRLGAVRDLQVLPKTLNRAEALLTAPLDRGGLSAAVDSERVRRVASLRSYLASDEYITGRRLYLNNDAAGALRMAEDRARIAFAGARDLPGRLRDAIPVLISYAIGRADAFHSGMDLSSVHDHHELRKLMKTARYILEFFSPLLGSAALYLATAAVTVQNQLGIVQDSITAEQLLADLSASDAALLSGLSILRRSAMDAASDAWLDFCDPFSREAMYREVTRA